MKTQNVSFFQKLKLMGGDVLLLYKNFLHWNLSKICISVWTFVLGIILGLPFLILLTTLALFDPIDWSAILGNVVLGQSVDYNVIGEILVHPFFVFFEVILLLLMFVSMIIGSSYGVVLRTNMYFGYLSENKIPYFNNLYFDRKIILQYIKVFFIVLAHLLLPIIILFLYFLFLNKFFPNLIYGVETLSLNSLFIAIPSLVVFVLFFYISYRLSFSYVVMIDAMRNGKNLTAKKIVKKSKKITRGWVIFPFLGVMLIYALFMFPFNALEDSINGNGSDAKLYLGYKTGQVSIETEQARDIYGILQKQFEGKTDNEVIENIVWLGRLKLLLAIVSFLLISGTLEMVAVSFYLHFLKQREKKSMLDRITKSVFKKTKKEL